MQDLEIDEWELYDALNKMNDDEFIHSVRSRRIDYPKDAIKWRDTVGQFSLHNEYAAIMSYFVTLRLHM